MKILNILNIIVIPSHLSLRLDFWSTPGFVYHLSYVANFLFAAVPYFFHFCHLNRNHDEKQLNEEYCSHINLWYYLVFEFCSNFFSDVTSTWFFTKPLDEISTNYKFQLTSDHKINTSRFTLAIKFFYSMCVCKKLKFLWRCTYTYLYIIRISSQPTNLMN